MFNAKKSLNRAGSFRRLGGQPFALALLVLIGARAVVAQPSTGSGPLAGAGPSIIYVKRTAAAGGDGTTWSRAFRSLDEAVRVADSDDTVWISRGTYAPPTDQVVGGITIRGGFAGTESSLALRRLSANPTIIAPADDDDAMRFIEGSVELDGLTFSGSDYTAVGGSAPLDVTYAHLVVRNCTFENNRLEDGAPASLMSMKTVLFENCTFRNNISADAGAGAISSNHYPLATSILEVRNCTFDGNIGRNAGAVSSNMDYTRIYNCLFYDNEAESLAGAVYTNGRYGEIINCTFSYDSTSSGAPGGAMLSDSEYSDVYNTTFWGNRNRLYFFTDVYLTMDDEQAQLQSDTPASVHLERRIVDGLNGSLFSYHDVVDVDPRFTNAAAGDFSLKVDSPCIDAGDTTLTPSSVTKDLAGVNRRINAAATANTGVASGGVTVDIGAYEYPY